MHGPGWSVSFDIWDSGIPHAHGGQKSVIGFNDQYSELNKLYLIQRKSDVAEVVLKYLAWARSLGVDVRAGCIATTRMSSSSRRFSRRATSGACA